MNRDLSQNETRTLHPTVFLDRDGTIIYEKDFLGDPGGVELLPSAAASIKRLNQAGYLVIIVSNQSGVARGYYDEAAVQRVNKRITEVLEDAGAHIDAVYYCPHHSKATVPEYRKDCHCRKPNPGMGQKALQDHPIDPAQMIMIGDRAADIQFGHNLGCRTVLVTTGYGRGERERIDDQGLPAPDFVAPNLASAIEWILGQ
jgi:D-glycero-D-manno-heptose 1,7-bisphosphate phosphatase